MNWRDTTCPATGQPCRRGCFDARPGPWARVLSRLRRAVLEELERIGRSGPGGATT